MNFFLLLTTALLLVVCLCECLVFVLGPIPHFVMQICQLQPPQRPKLLVSLFQQSLIRHFASLHARLSSGR